MVVINNFKVASYTQASTPEGCTAQVRKCFLHWTVVSVHTRWYVDCELMWRNADWTGTDASLQR